MPEESIKRSINPKKRDDDQVVAWAETQRIPLSVAYVSLAMQMLDRIRAGERAAGGADAQS